MVHIQGENSIQLWKEQYGRIRGHISNYHTRTAEDTVDSVSSMLPLDRAMGKASCHAARILKQPHGYKQVCHPGGRVSSPAAHSDEK